MAVEKMKLLNLVIEIESAHEVLKDIAMVEKIHLEDSMVEINESNFKLKVDEEHIDEVAELCIIDAFSEKRDHKSIQQKLFQLMDYMSIEKKIDKECLKEPFVFEDLERDVNAVYDELLEIRNRIDELEIEKETLSVVEIIDGIFEKDVDFKKLFNLEFFNVKLGTITKENIVRLERNYENIYAAVLHIGKNKHSEIYLVVSLNELEIETDRILRSVYFEEVKLLPEYLGKPVEMHRKIYDRLDFINQELEGLHSRADEYDRLYGEKLKVSYSQLMLELKIDQMKKLLAVTSSYVYITGWASENDVKHLEKTFGKYGDKMVFSVREVSEVTTRIKPPTKLKNNWLFKPFESLVGMYGTPSYSEADPTLFVAMAYMFLFGAMFGDLGQGFVLFLAGIFMTKKAKRNQYGKVLSRIGISSMIFGIIYDSFFGYEHVISGLFGKVFSDALAEKVFLRPIENINQMLILAIVTGMIFIFISYGYSILNKLRNDDIKEGYFGRNGINGTILFISIIMLVLKAVLNIAWIPGAILKVVILVCIILMVVRGPLTNILKKKKPLYSESVSEYYIESVFELLETFLGMLSNSVSFIRVGAFALNHVGLFMAFHTIAKLIDSTMGDVSMFIVGNIIVIALEGLIVLIQGLRLVYYEMFSKYYTGDGFEFVPVMVENIGGSK